MWCRKHQQQQQKTEQKNREWLGQLIRWQESSSKEDFWAEWSEEGVILTKNNSHRCYWTNCPGRNAFIILRENIRSLYYILKHY